MLQDYSSKSFWRRAEILHSRIPKEDISVGSLRFRYLHDALGTFKLWLNHIPSMVCDLFDFSFQEGGLVAPSVDFSAVSFSPEQICIQGQQPTLVCLSNEFFSVATPRF